MKLMFIKNKIFILIIVFLGLVVLIIPSLVYAESAYSANYQIHNVFFGAGGNLNQCSSNYCAKTSIGEIAVGNTKSTNYQAQAGFNTNRSPSISMVINSTNVNLGTLSTKTTATATAQFTVSSYLASGYQVETISPPPTNNSATLTALSTPTTSQPGIEQFGMNLVANTSPIDFGSNPDQIPSSAFSYGQVSSNYDSPNLYMYQPGSVIAYSDQSSGQTEFTISYIFNISHLTPGGVYTFNDVLVATSTY